MSARTMATREFLHGGYREKNGAVVVLSGGEVAGVWFPGQSAIVVEPPKAIIIAEPPANFRPVPKPTAAKKRRAR